jgi:hypothetical protein
MDSASLLGNTCPESWVDKTPQPNLQFDQVKDCHFPRIEGWLTNKVYRLVVIQPSSIREANQGS